MCIICIQFEQGKLTRYEAQQALTEFVETKSIDPDHIEEVYDKLSEVEE